MYWRRTEIGAPPTGPAKYDPDHSRFAFQWCRRSSGNSCRSRRDERPLREFTSRDRASFGGKFTSRWTWLVSPLDSARPVSKSVHTARMIFSVRPRCRAVNTGCRYLVGKNQLSMHDAGHDVLGTAGTVPGHNT